MFVYSFWVFTIPGPWSRAITAAGGKLPETQPGLPAIEPVRSLEALSQNMNDYLLWQVLDIPYFVLTFLASTAAIALGLKMAGKWGRIFKIVLFLPAIYVVAELIENSLLALFAAGIVAPVEPLVLVQQIATTLKFSSAMPAMLFSLIGIVFATIVLVIGAVRKNS
ncbi:hypothetical protein ABFZ85_12640 [Hyphococcus formosus]|uniref:hypothetical protein n=1 Tax=Hyphococcus formosus TaxID=3143534 RepID=UPI00398A6818